MKTRIPVNKPYPKSGALSCLYACLLLTIILVTVPAVQASPFNTLNTVSYSPVDSASVSRPRPLSPIRFVRFRAFGSNGRVSIGWKVSNEKDQFEYIIERSADGVGFVPVGTL